MVSFGFTCNQDSMANKTEYVELGMACADVCTALERGMNGKRLDELSQPVREAISQLTTWVKLVTRARDGSLILIAGLSRISRRGSLRRVNGTDSPGLSMPRVIRMRSWLGS